MNTRFGKYWYALGTAALVAVLLMPGKCHAQASFEGLGILPGESFSDARDVSSDGTFVVGYSSGPQAFTWEGGVMQGLAGLPGSNHTDVWDVSSDGNIIVGVSNGQAVRWEAGVPQGLGGLPGYSVSRGRGVSADGNVVVGDAAQPGRMAFIWDATGGMQALGVLPGYSESRANDVSADGSIVVGECYLQSPFLVQAFVWDAAGGMRALDYLPGGGNDSSADSVSADGSVVVGQSDNALSQWEAVIWNDSGVHGLGFLPGGDSSFAYDVSADGSIVVGDSQTPTGWQAFIWDATHGMRNLQEVLETEYGLELTGWQLNAAYAISDDGRVIIGSGPSPLGYQAWRAVLPNTTPGIDVVVEPSDATTGEAPVLLNFQEVTAAGETTLTTSEEGEPPTGFKLGSPATFYELETTAEFNGSIEICINYSGISYEDEPGLKLFHLEDGNWIDVTTSVDTENDIICGEVTSFSPFAIVELDTDEDGLADARELVLGTDPYDPDTDDDGLLDGTEVEMAAGTGCPDPLNPDSDGDTLLDGSGELPLGTSPCNPDTDGDQVPDQIDPDPLMPGEIGDVLEAIARMLCLDIQSSDLSEFNGPNNNANKGRRNSLSTRCANAANSIADDDVYSAIALLHTVLEKIDGIEPIPDWMVESNTKSDLAASVNLLIELLLLE